MEEEENIDFDTLLQEYWDLKDELQYMNSLIADQTENNLSGFIENRSVLIEKIREESEILTNQGYDLTDRNFDWF